MATYTRYKNSSEYRRWQSVCYPRGQDIYCAKGEFAYGYTDRPGTADGRKG